MNNVFSNSTILCITLLLLIIIGVVSSCENAKKYDYIGKFDDDGFAVVRKGTHYGFINKAEEEVIKPQFDMAWNFEKGLARVEKNGKYGFITTKGKTFIPFQYDDAWPFSEGWAAVQKGKKWHYIDKENKIVLRTKYDRVWPFVEERAIVLKGRYYGYIDKKGKEVVRCQYQNARNFYQGLGWVHSIAPSKWIAVDKQGVCVKKCRGIK